MKKSKQIKKLKNRLNDLEKIVKKDGILFTNPENENSKAFIGIRNDALVTEGILHSQTVVVLPITNQQL